ncbi:hypothetical protein U9M48_022884 [Paspalum notatum var. saurae]|uniref:Uncharacterized protein n=1 Tax=Paspalum notatum var. saurae TaxID=547442 RepID=A0AAQ3TN94_PASNO
MAGSGFRRCGSIEMGLQDLAVRHETWGPPVRVAFNLSTTPPRGAPAYSDVRRATDRRPHPAPSAPASPRRRSGLIPLTLIASPSLFPRARRQQQNHGHHGRPRELELHAPAISGPLSLSLRAQRARLDLLHYFPKGSPLRAILPTAFHRRRHERHRGDLSPTADTPAPLPSRASNRLLRVRHLPAELSRPPSSSPRARAARNRTATPRHAELSSLQFIAAAPLFLYTPGDDIWGKRSPIAGNASPDPDGFKFGPQHAGVAPSSPSRRAIT